MVGVKRYVGKSERVERRESQDEGRKIWTWSRHRVVRLKISAFRSGSRVESGVCSCSFSTSRLRIVLARRGTLK